MVYLDMKQSVWAGLLTLGAVILLAPACGRKAPGPPPHPLDVLYGFRDVRFGQAPGQIVGLSLTKPVFRATGIDYVAYERSKENLQVGHVTLDNITYAFFKNQLTEIDLLWEPRTRSDPSVPPPLFHVLTNRFGPPSSQKVEAPRLEFHATWEGVLVRLTLVELPPKEGATKKGRGVATIVAKGLAAQRDAATAVPDPRQKSGF